MAALRDLALGIRGRARLRLVPGSARPRLPPLTRRHLLPGQDRRGFSFNARAFLGVGIGGGFELGLSGAMQRAPEFREMRVAIVLRAAGLYATCCTLFEEATGRRS